MTVFLIIKQLVNQEDITIINIYSLNIGASKYIKQMLRYMKAEIDSNTIIVKDFNTFNNE